jgi:hypothetical protein
MPVQLLLQSKSSKNKATSARTQKKMPIVSNIIMVPMMRAAQSIHSLQPNKENFVTFAFVLLKGFQLQMLLQSANSNQC